MNLLSTSDQFEIHVIYPNLYSSIFFSNCRPKIVTTNTKVDRREIGKERKALKAAQLDRAIENELLERLKQVSENEIYNYPEQQYKKILSRVSEKFEGNYSFTFDNVHCCNSLEAILDKKLYRLIV